ncbi:hypothetical protein ACQ4PT_058202 [Festuca glaucescens]
MTVEALSGDRGGDLAAQTPVRVSTASEVREELACSSERFSGSRFWLLQSEDVEENEEDADEEVGQQDGVSSAGIGDKSVKYLCRTPSPVSDADLVEGSSELSRRQRKRIVRRDGHRMAAAASLFFSIPEGMNSSPPLPLGKQLRSSGGKAMPVLQPSVFFDDTTEGWTVVRRQRWSPAPDVRFQDPRSKVNSKNYVVGQVGLRACTNSSARVVGPIWLRKRGSHVAGSDGERGPRIATVGNAGAGHAFRNMLGLTWKKCETRAPVVRRRRVEIKMNGDGGRGVSTQGGVDTILDEAAMAAAVVATAMLEAPLFRGDAMLRDLVVEGLGMDLAGDFMHDGSWGNSNAGFHRGSTYNNSSDRFGYGGNQQRWNTGRGGAYANRPRTQGAEGGSRTSFDADLLHQTVQAVVAAVTAATKVTESSAVHASPAPTGVAGTGGAATTVAGSGGAAMVDSQQVGVPVAVPNPNEQQNGTIQGIPEGTQVAAKGKDIEGQGPPKKKKEDKAGCFQCKKPGHYIDDCPTPFCDICESIHHATPACHLLNAPKPSATLHGYANEALMFFEMPCGAFKAKAENPKLAKVTVDGDVLTIPEIIEQLKKIVPSEKFN